MERQGGGGGWWGGGGGGGGGGGWGGVGGGEMQFPVLLRGFDGDVDAPFKVLIEVSEKLTFTAESWGAC